METSSAFRNLKLEVANNAAIQMFLRSWSMFVTVRYMVHRLTEDAFAMPSLINYLLELLLNYTLLLTVAFSCSYWYQLVELVPNFLRHEKSTICLWGWLFWLNATGLYHWGFLPNNYIQVCCVWSGRVGGRGGKKVEGERYRENCIHIKGNRKESKCSKII